MSVECSAVSGFGIYADKYVIAKFFDLEYADGYDEYNEEYDWGGISDDEYHVAVSGSHFSGEIEYYIFIRDCYNPVTILKKVELMKIKLEKVGINKEVKHYKDTLWH